jgi:hypothetical protein
MNRSVEAEQRDLRMHQRAISKRKRPTVKISRKEQRKKKGKRNQKKQLQWKLMRREGVRGGNPIKCTIFFW